MRLGRTSIKRLTKLKKLTPISELSHSNKKKRGKGRGIKRSYYAMIHIACCRDGVETWKPLPMEISGESFSKKFTYGLIAWEKDLHNILHKKYYKKAERDCGGIGSKGVCHFEIELHVKEEIIK